MKNEIPRRNKDEWHPLEIQVNDLMEKIDEFGPHPKLIACLKLLQSVRDNIIYLIDEGFLDEMDEDEEEF